MAKSHKQQLQDLFSEFQRMHPEMQTVPLDYVYRWAKTERKWEPHPRDEARWFRDQMADALRDEYRTDSAGRRHRAKLPVTTFSGGVQTVLWGDIDDMPLPIFQKNVQQRRKQIVGDCVQLRLDIDHYNDAHPLVENVQTELFDFTDDVEEKMFELHRKNAA